MGWWWWKQDLNLSIALRDPLSYSLTPHFSLSYQMPRIAVIPGDGIGVEVMREARKVLATLNDTESLDLELVDWDLGADFDWDFNLGVGVDSNTDLDMDSDLSFVKSELALDVH